MNRVPPLLLVLSFSAPWSTAAAASPPTRTAPEACAEPAEGTAGAAGVGRVVGVEPPALHLGEPLVVQLDSCATARRLQAASRDRGSPIALVLDGRLLPDLVGEVLLDRPLVRFTLVPAGTEAAGWWAQQFAGAGLGPVEARITVGLADGSLLLPSEQPVSLERFRPGTAAVAFALALLIGLLGWRFRRGGLLRDQGRPPDGGEASYSLARVQAAFWFANVVLAHLVVTSVTGSAPAIPASLLALTGIGTGTLLGATVIDARRDGVAPRSEGFWPDLLQDSNGHSLHRVQMVAWSLVLAALFWRDVLARLTLPDLDSSLVALTGLSATGYLGMKLPERRLFGARREASAPAGEPPAAEASAAAEEAPER